MAERSPSKAEGAPTAGYIVTTWPRLSQTFVLNEILTPDFARKLAAEARGLPIRILPFVDDSTSCIATADLVVCMAGYNTLSEVLYFKKKALVVPRSGPSAEQRTRAGLFAQRCLIDVLDPADLSPESLAERLVEDLERSDYPKPNGTPPMDGAVQAADRLWELLQAGNYAASA